MQVYNTCEFDKIPLYSTGENCVFKLKLFNEVTTDEYDMFTSGCNSIVCLNRRLNVGHTSQRSFTFVIILFVCNFFHQTVKVVRGDAYSRMYTNLETIHTAFISISNLPVYKVVTLLYVRSISSFAMCALMCGKMTVN